MREAVTLPTGPQGLITWGLEEAAAFLHMAPSTLRKRAAAGEVPGYKPGRHWVFLPDEILAYLQASRPAHRPTSTALLRTDARWRTEISGSRLAQQIRAQRRNLMPLEQGLDNKLKSLKSRRAPVRGGKRRAG